MVNLAAKLNGRFDSVTLTVFTGGPSDIIFKSLSRLGLCRLSQYNTRINAAYTNVRRALETARQATTLALAAAEAASRPGMNSVAGM